MQVRSLSWEDALEKGMATHCSILVWRIPWTEEPGGLQSMGLQSDTTEETEHACTAESVQPGFLILMSDGAPHSRC